MRRHNQTGFTILEVMVSFVVLLVIIAGMSTAMTASMRLNATQRERSLAQDLVRDVTTKYVKTVAFDDPSSITADLTPYDEGVSMVTTYNTGLGYTRTLYDSSANPEVNNLEGAVNLTYMVADLKGLDRAKLDLVFFPIKKTACTSCTNLDFYTTKINVIVRLTWDNGTRTIEIPSVVGQGDVTRAERDKFTDPHVPAVAACTSSGVAPASGSVCCSGLVVVNGLCATAICTPTGQNRSSYSNLACCTGSTDDGAGLCVANATCTLAGSNISTTGGLACCANSTDDGTGLCVANATCTPAGALRSANGNAPCCTGTTETSGQCITACSTAGQSPASGGSCCSGLVLSSGTCITCIAAFSTPPGGNATLCCSGQVFTSNGNGGNSGECKN
ncbi:MAG: prepilin-type N-terminal cleavage/methylation domain-containing protein [Candidatus Sericytochromatia bacterium]